MYRRILVPLDGSPLAEAALPHAVAIARRFEARLTLLQVVSTISMAAAVDPLGASGAETVLAMEAMEAGEQAAQDYLNEVAQRISLDLIPVEMEVARGRPAPSILRRCREGDIDLVVMSTHGRSGVGRLVFGSVADQVLREAGIPTLVIHPRSR